MAVNLVYEHPGPRDVPYTGKREYLVDGEDDLVDIPDDAPIGSAAYTADGKNIWIRNNAGEWKKFGG